MQINLSPLNGKLSVIVAIAVLVSFTGIPLAMANPDPGVIGSPITIIVGTDTNVVINAVGGGGHNGREITVYDQAATLADNSACPVDLPGAGGNVPVTTATWRLRNIADTEDIRYFLPSGSSLSVPFGAITGYSNTVVTGVGGAKFTTDGTDPAISGTATTSPVAAKWVSVVGGPILAPNTARVGIYQIATCGTEPPSNSGMEASGAFEATLQVGGEILSINSAAVLIAGISTSAIWMFPTVGAIVGTSIALYKLRKN